MRYDKMTHSEFVIATKYDKNLCLIAYTSHGDEDWTVWKDKKNHRYYLLNAETFFEVVMVANLYFNTKAVDYIENSVDIATMHLAMQNMFPHDYYSLTIDSRINHWWFIRKGSKKRALPVIEETETEREAEKEVEPVKDEFTKKVEKMHELTTEFLELEDDLSSAGAHSRLSSEIEELAWQISIMNTDLTVDDLITFLDEHHIKQ